MSDGRPSLAHLADKFNTAPPPGYVAGRGRGATGFSKPPPPDEGGKGGKARDKGGGKGGGKGSGSSGDGVNGGDGGASSSSAAAVGPAGPPGKIEGDVANTDRLDLKDTERFEEAELSMDAKEAGFTIDAFSMAAERKEGNFDEDFNFVWKRKGEDPDDVHDAFLDEVDSGEAESAEKLQKRRRLLAQQAAAQAEPDEPKVDARTLLRRAADLMLENESVAAALRRLSGKKAGSGQGQGQQQQRQRSGGKRPRDEADGGGAGADEDLEGVIRKQQFEQLTESADALLRGGRFDIYSERREAILQEVGSEGGGGDGEGLGGGEAMPKGGAESSSAAAAHEAASLGIDTAVHDGMVAGGFVLDGANRVYYNRSSGLYFDPRTTLYWNASAPGTYYYYDSASGQFVPAEVPAS